MAPEIKQGLEYNGHEIDIFSSGVILFILVTGNFPFTEAIATEKYYKLLLEEEYSDYWEKVSNGLQYSNSFKDLF